MLLFSDRIDRIDWMEGQGRRASGRRRQKTEDSGQRTEDRGQKEIDSVRDDVKKFSVFLSAIQCRDWGFGEWARRGGEKRKSGSVGETVTGRQLRTKGR